MFLVRPSHRNHNRNLSASARNIKQAMHQVLAQEDLKPRHVAGSAPGIDVQRITEFGTSRQVETLVVDWSQDEISCHVVTNNALADLLKEPRPAHSKVRWINCSGLSFDVLKVLAIHFEMHPLAVEDVLHLPQRIKADFFPQHTYISMLLPLLLPPNLEAEDNTNSLPPLFTGHHILLQQTTTLTPTELEFLQRPDVHLEECSIFLLPDNTILSLFQQSGRKVTDKILEVLHGAPHATTASPSSPQPLSQILFTLQASANPTRLTALRRAEDTGLLLHALADGIVDTYFSIVELYETQIAHTQDLVLTRPRSAYVKTLYLMRKEVSCLRRALHPTESLVLHLRDRTTQLSETCRTYFGDVLDHVLTVMEDLGAMEVTTEGLIDLTFNTMSFQTNENMKLLSVVSAVFLPISFVAGVYGTNFDYFPELHLDIGIFYFYIWTVAIIIVAIAISKRMGMLENLQ
ncbi:cora-like Mg2+ transporter protein-domain-containing protein [Chytriomyces sp. MP71]|nr:cora-like Mg2+ transporter protein-domain-containing protein [Chytriomyces sp. MP71]